MKSLEIELLSRLQKRDEFKGEVIEPLTNRSLDVDMSFNSNDYEQSLLLLT